jgi:hypothetical protein
MYENIVNLLERKFFVAAARERSEFHAWSTEKKKICIRYSMDLEELVKISI